MQDGNNHNTYNKHTPKNTDTDWDSFDFETWGVNDDNTVRAETSGLRVRAGDERRSNLDNDDEYADKSSADGGWISQGGVLRWEEPGDEEEAPRDARSEARSRWAADAIDLPPGTPDTLRLRSLRAWLLRQRLLESEAMGQLLLERRQQYQQYQQQQHDDDESSAMESMPETPDAPLELAIAGQQAAIEVYEALVESLDEMATHSGPARVLVEYYLWLNERLTILANEPEAPVDFAEQHLLAPLDTGEEPATSQQQSLPTARSIAQWHGRAQAALSARRRIEQVSTPEPED